MPPLYVLGHCVSCHAGIPDILLDSEIVVPPPTDVEDKKVPCLPAKIFFLKADFLTSRKGPF